jgi:hypothetical protein
VIMGTATVGPLAVRPLAVSSVAEPIAAIKAAPKDAWIIGIDSVLTEPEDASA